MSADQQARNYRVPGVNIQVCCSTAMASCLDARFRLIPVDASSCEETIYFEFRDVSNSNQHAVERPAGEARAFYEMPKGEASYFQSTDQVYISFENGVRALCEPRAGRTVFSTVESDPRNLFVASHLVLTIVRAFRKTGPRS
jgi:hypothetical protein